MLSKRLLVDNFVCRLHYRWTVLLLIALSFVVTCRLVLGHSFSCESINGISQSHLETKCYADTVYSLPSRLIKNTTPAVESRIHGYRRYQSFYSWVNLLLLIHAAGFYFPHVLWKSYESGYLVKLTSGLTDSGSSEEKRSSELCFLAKYVLVTQGHHKIYTSSYIIYEVCNYVIALVQTLWLVHFFAVTGVPDFLPFKITNWRTFQQYYFPHHGLCSIVVEKLHHQTTCLLPLNDLYMKIFLFLHAWYIALAILAGLSLIFRIMLLVPFQRILFLHISAPLIEKDSLKSLCHRLSYSDWFFLTRFLRVMTDIDFAQMVSKMEVLSACKGRCSLLQDDNGSLLSDDNHKELESSIATSPV